MMIENEGQKVVQMHIIDPGAETSKGEFSFEMQPRYNPGRTVRFSLIPSDAEKLFKALAAYIEVQKKV